jgi:hypothetical protein
MNLGASNEIVWSPMNSLREAKLKNASEAVWLTALTKFYWLFFSPERSCPFFFSALRRNCFLWMAERRFSAFVFGLKADYRCRSFPTMPFPLSSGDMLAMRSQFVSSRALFSALTRETTN